MQTKANSITSLCRVLGVSRSGYYAARVRQSAPKKVCPVAVHLQAAFVASGRTYGSRRLCAALQADGVNLGRYRIRTLMKINGIQPAWKRKFIHTTDSRHDQPIAENVLDRQFTPTAANVAWVSDITYIRTRSGWLYLAAVMDLFSRKIIGWAMAPNMPAELVCAALRMALPNANRPPDWSCILIVAVNMPAMPTVLYWPAMVSWGA